MTQSLLSPPPSGHRSSGASGFVVKGKVQKVWMAQLVNCVAHHKQHKIVVFQTHPSKGGFKLVCVNVIMTFIPYTLIKWQHYYTKIILKFKCVNRCSSSQTTKIVIVQTHHSKTVWLVGVCQRNDDLVEKKSKEIYWLLVCAHIRQSVTFVALQHLVFSSETYDFYIAHKQQQCLSKSVWKLSWYSCSSQKQKQIKHIFNGIYGYR